MKDVEKMLSKEKKPSDREELAREIVDEIWNNRICGANYEPSVKWVQARLESGAAQPDGFGDALPSTLCTCGHNRLNHSLLGDCFAETESRGVCQCQEFTGASVGEGAGTGAEACPRCEGRGKYSRVPAVDKPCALCNGTGRTRVETDETCTCDEFSACSVCADAKLGAKSREPSPSLSRTHGEARAVELSSPQPLIDSRKFAERIFFHVLLHGGEENPFTKIRNEWFIDLAAPKIAELLSEKGAVVEGTGTGAREFYAAKYPDLLDEVPDWVFVFAEDYCKSVHAAYGKVLDRIRRMFGAEPGADVIELAEQSSRSLQAIRAHVEKCSQCVVCEDCEGLLK